LQSTDADRNLLFGILALQMDFIEREQLIEAMHDWVLAKEKPLSELLIQNGALEPSDRDLLEPMVARHVEIHQGDAEKSLGSLSSVGSVRDDLRSIADSDVAQSVGYISLAHRASDLDTTELFTGASTSAGQRFRVLRFHAEGGLGKISVALDAELHREVALKEIHATRADDPDTRARFILEAEITGRLEHPGIVQVYGLGQYDDGRPFYVMRFIRGNSLKVAIDQFHEANKNGRDPSERMLELRKLLGRFIDVCNAIEYAHSRGACGQSRSGDRQFCRSRRIVSARTITVDLTPESNSSTATTPAVSQIPRTSPREFTRGRTRSSFVRWTRHAE
jgi:serine/threonine-protein kinase